MDFQKFPDLSLEGWVWDKTPLKYQVWASSYKDRWFCSTTLLHTVFPSAEVAIVGFILVWDSEKNLITWAVSETLVVSVGALALICIVLPLD